MELMWILCQMVILKCNFIDFRYETLRFSKRAIWRENGAFTVSSENLSASFKDFLFLKCQNQKGKQK